MPRRATSPFDPWIKSVHSALAAREKELPPIPEARDDLTHAAVSVVLRQGPETDLLLIKRAEVEGDPWSGHMALPGGRRQREDATLEETARRETREETDLSLDPGGELLGRLKPLEPSTFRLPPISIFPFVFAVPEGTSARVASREVEEVFWTPLSRLANPSTRGSTRIHLSDEIREFPCFDLDGRVVWGLTYRILSDLMTVIPGSGGDPPGG